MREIIRIGSAMISMYCYACAAVKQQQIVLSTAAAATKLRSKVPSSLDISLDELLDRAVDIFWERRRYGELWESARPPDSFFASAVKCNVDEYDIPRNGKSNENTAFKLLVFDLVGEVLKDVFEDEVYVDYPVWMRTKLPRQRILLDQFPPSSANVLKPYVKKHVYSLLDLPSSGNKLLNSKQITTDTNTVRRFGNGQIGKQRFMSCRRANMDIVDRILMLELWQTESDWFDYGEDELDLKMWVTESIWHSLLQETALIVEDSYHYKRSQNITESFV